MQVIEKPKYPEENIAECEVCLCKFKYHNGEVLHEWDNDYPFASGTGYHKYVKCPCCEKKHTLICEFYETKTWLDSLIELLANIKERICERFKKSK